eukprot:4605839-Amphidinium_carterae.1
MVLHSSCSSRRYCSGCSLRGGISGVDPTLRGGGDAVVRTPSKAGGDDAQSWDDQCVLDEIGKAQKDLEVAPQNLNASVPQPFQPTQILRK